MNYREFYIWLEGYLHNKLENEHINIVPIVEKMSQVVSDEKNGLTTSKDIEILIHYQ